jgi:multiple sugar transport system permease protein
MSASPKSGAIQKPSHWPVSLFCLTWLLITLFPIYWIFVTSLKSPLSVNAGPTYVPWLDFAPTLDAWRAAFSGQRGDFLGPLMNSIAISLTSAIVALIIGSMAAYALVRFEFRVKLLAAISFAIIAIGGYVALVHGVGLGKVPALAICFALSLSAALFLNSRNLPGPVLGNNDVVFWFVSQRMFPPIVSAFALYLIYAEMGKAGIPLLDSFVGLVLSYTAFALPIVIWLMRDFFAALPVEVEEAALIDNVSRLRIFFQIVVPMSWPGLIATFMITLSFVWNEFLNALLLTTSKWQTLPVWLTGQNSYRGDEWWAIAVAAVISITPMIVVAAALSRFMRSGLAQGAIR